MVEAVVVVLLVAKLHLQALPEARACASAEEEACSESPAKLPLARAVAAIKKARSPATLALPWPAEVSRNIAKMLAARAGSTRGDAGGSLSFSHVVSLFLSVVSECFC